LQLTLGRIVERRSDHVRLLYDLQNGTTVAQKIVASSILPITEILTIENHKLDNTFLYVAFRSQSLLEPTNDQTSSDTNSRTEGGDWRGGGEREPNQILFQESVYVPSSIPKDKTLQKGDEHTNQQPRNDPLEVTNATKK
jgi:hypothetical protein